ncbi:hypothetical protein KIN20_033412 [Parelaphostrongylus tenuis]|uniref:Uncharacterized protein n=1 Tax=Parelaphostrongylus tenuis TaxID=148309 RepID=A0AAD5R8M9_PARTN|nr:hypothetical protein KIN20_033412 [Parelaphostrongylus tenuis]
MPINDVFAVRCGAKNLLGKKYTLVDKSLYCGYKTCGGEEELFIDDRTASCSSPPRRIPATMTSNRGRKFPSKEGRVLEALSGLPPCSSNAPRPPQRAPPPPPAENVYETVLPSTAQRTECHHLNDEIEAQNYYSRTPSKTRRRERAWILVLLLAQN